MEDRPTRPAAVADVHELAQSMPHVTRWAESEADKQSMVDDPDSPFFTTPRFNGHVSALLRAKDLPAITYTESAVGPFESHFRIDKRRAGHAILTA